MDATVVLNASNPPSATQGGGRRQSPPARRLLLSIASALVLVLMTAFVLVCQEAVRKGERFRAEQLQPEPSNGVIADARAGRG